MLRRPVLLATIAALFAGPFVAQPALAQTSPVRLRGTVRALDERALTIEDRNGDPVSVALAANYTVTAIVPATLDAIKPGSTIGVVGFGPPTQQRAAAITVFPPDAAITASQFPWDTQPGSVMTNAPVTSSVAATDGRVLTVTIKGEPIQVTVPEAAVIQTLEPGTPDMLTPGAKVLIFAQRAADGAISANRVNVGKAGFTPAN